MAPFVWLWVRNRVTPKWVALFSSWTETCGFLLVLILTHAHLPTNWATGFLGQGINEPVEHRRICRTLLRARGRRPAGARVLAADSARCSQPQKRGWPGPEKRGCPPHAPNGLTRPPRNRKMKSAPGQEDRLGRKVDGTGLPGVIIYQGNPSFSKRHLCHKWTTRPLHAQNRLTPPTTAITRKCTRPKRHGSSPPNKSTCSFEQL